MIENEWSKFNTCQEDIKTLYKYRRLKNKNEDIVDEHTLNMMKNGEIKLSAPDEFNDPFDCKIEFASQNKDNDNILKQFDTKPENNIILAHRDLWGNNGHIKPTQVKQN
jgi:hypothetical protein